jgi:hypothetical protein
MYILISDQLTKILNFGSFLVISDAYTVLIVLGIDIFFFMVIGS